MSFLSIKDARNDEYEFQNYQITANCIFDYVCQNMKRIIKKRCDDLTKNLKNFSDDDEAKQKADKMYKALCKLYYEKMALHLLKMKEKIAEWLRIPDDTLAPEDKLQSVQKEDCNLQYRIAERKKVKQKLRNEIILQAVLKMKLEDLDNATKIYNDTMSDNVKDHLDYGSQVTNELKHFLLNIEDFTQNIDVSKEMKTVLNPETVRDIDLEDL